LSSVQELSDTESLKRHLKTVLFQRCYCCSTSFLGVDSCGPTNYIWAEVKTGRIHSQQQGVSSRRWGLLPDYFRRSFYEKQCSSCICRHTQEAEKKVEEERIRMENIIKGNPLMQSVPDKPADFKVRRRFVVMG